MFADGTRIGQVAFDAILFDNLIKQQGMFETITGNKGIQEEDPLELSRLFGIPAGTLD